MSGRWPLANTIDKSVAVKGGIVVTGIAATIRDIEMRDPPPQGDSNYHNHLRVRDGRLAFTRVFMAGGVRSGLRSDDSEVTVSSCYVANYEAHGLSFYRSSFVVENSVVANNREGIVIGSQDDEVGEIRHSTFHGNESPPDPNYGDPGAISSNDYLSTDFAVQAYNNVVWGNSSHQGRQIVERPSFVWDHSVVEGGHPGTMILTTDPRLEFQLGAIVGIGAGSSANDTGKPSSVKFDITGKPRDPARPDMGAFEY